VPQRDAVLERMKESGIACGIHYPVPIHLQAAYAGLGFEAGAFLVAERGARSLLSLPMYAELTAEQIDNVTAGLEEALSGASAAGAADAGAVPARSASLATGTPPVATPANAERSRAEPAGGFPPTELRAPSAVHGEGSPTAAR